VIFTCKGCSVQFKSYEHDARYCSIQCLGRSRRAVDGEKLKHFAFTGAHMWDMAEAFGVHRRVVRKWLQRDGLYEQWKEQRYA
jgi:hypothetical protein